VHWCAVCNMCKLSLKYSLQELLILMFCEELKTREKTC
jgi:hypothetical protein